MGLLHFPLSNTDIIGLASVMAVLIAPFIAAALEPLKEKIFVF
jgi:hypothetical protein